MYFMIFIKYLLGCMRKTKWIYQKNICKGGGK